jgi:hypothetical protein
MQHGDADLLGEVRLAVVLIVDLAFEVALEQVDQAGVGAGAQDGAVRHGDAVEQAQRTRVQALEDEGLRGPVLDEDRHVAQVREDLRRQLLQSILGDLVEA